MTRQGVFTVGPAPRGSFLRSLLQKQRPGNPKATRPAGGSLPQRLLGRGRSGMQQGRGLSTRFRG